MSETQPPQEHTSWIAILAKVTADVEDRLKALPNVTIDSKRIHGDWHRFLVTQEKGDCTVEVVCDYPKYSYRRGDIIGLKIKVNGGAWSKVRKVTWHRHTVPVSFPYDKIIKRVVDTLASVHAETVAKEKDRERRNADYQEMVALCEGLLTPEEVQFSGMIRKVHDTFVVQVPNLTADQARRILEIAKEPKAGVVTDDGKVQETGGDGVPGASAN